MRLVIFGVLVVSLLAGAAPTAQAQGFISPLIGYNFGGDAGCPKITNCQDKKLNAGVALGAMNSVLGFEEEFAYAKNFFGDAPNLNSSVLTVMSNFMIVPAIGPVRPYVLAGIGLIKTHIDFTTSSIFTSDNNNLGWDVGGGLMIFPVEHVGIRGDIRYIHAFQDLKIQGLTVSDMKLDFGRASGAVVFRF